MTDAPIDLVFGPDGELLHPEVLRLLPPEDVAELIAEGVIDADDDTFDIRQTPNGDPQRG